METYARVVADSIAPSGVRLTTLELCFHRFILPEFNTHRMFSRNAASSRAIPTKKLLEQVEKEPAMPVHWGKNKSGMQATEEVFNKEIAQRAWELAAGTACHYTNELTEFLGVHKQIANRLLEPFMWIKVIVTATEWDNFFKLRLHKDAQPEMMVLAEHMKEAMEGSTPVTLQPGQWHLPFLVESSGNLEDDIKCSVARCARVAVLKHDGTHPSLEDDLKLYDRLVGSSPEHASPCEHIATPMDIDHMRNSDFINNIWPSGISHCDKHGNLWSGNFRGWRMYRKIMEDTEWAGR